MQAQDLLKEPNHIEPGMAEMQHAAHTERDRRPTVKPARKPFVAPKLKEEASLEGVTLVSAGQPTRSNAGTKDNLASRTSQGGRAA